MSAVPLLREFLWKAYSPDFFNFFTYLVFTQIGPVLFSDRSMCNSAFSGLAACNSGRVCLVCKSISGRIFTPSFFILDEAVRPELL